MTNEQIQARAEQLSAQIKPNGGFAHIPAFNGTAEINKLIADLTGRLITAAAATTGNMVAETLTADARSQLDAAHPCSLNQIKYPTVFLAIATAESLLEELEAIAGA